MRQAILNLEESKIREVANAGMGRGDVLPFWFGESDEGTPEAVRAAAIASLQAGETFYSHNLGLPELRQAVADYASALHGPVAVDRIAITSGGVNALMLAMQALLDAGDEVVAVTPVWPNLTAQPVILGARLRCVALQPQSDGAWTLDLPKLLAAITPQTRLLVVNAPNNPTGWTLSRAEQQAILARCRETGTWILSDEVYERLYYAGDTALGAAPSFLDIANADDRLVVVQSFSKSFLMTGWRLGWLTMPAAMTPPRRSSHGRSASYSGRRHNSQPPGWIGILPFPPILHWIAPAIVLSPPSNSPCRGANKWCPNHGKRLVLAERFPSFSLPVAPSNSRRRATGRLLRESWTAIRRPCSLRLGWSNCPKRPTRFLPRRGSGCGCCPGRDAIRRYWSWPM